MSKDSRFMQINYILGQKDRVVDYNNAAIRDWDIQMQGLHQKGHLTRSEVFKSPLYTRLGTMSRINAFVIEAVRDMEYHVQRTKIAMVNDLYLPTKLHVNITNILNFHVFDKNDRFVDYLPKLTDIEKEKVDLREEAVPQPSPDSIAFSMNFSCYLFATLENAVRCFDLSFNKSS